MSDRLLLRHYPPKAKRELGSTLRYPSWRRPHRRRRSPATAQHCGMAGQGRSLTSAAGTSHRNPVPTGADRTHPHAPRHRPETHPSAATAGRLPTRPRTQPRCRRTEPEKTEQADRRADHSHETVSIQHTYSAFGVISQGGGARRPCTHCDGYRLPCCRQRVGHGVARSWRFSCVGALESDGTVQPRLWAISGHAPLHQRKLPAELARPKRLHVGPGAEPTPRASPRSVMPMSVHSVQG